MKTKTLFIQIILPVLFIIAAESSLQAQTVIKEKVILKPTKTLSAVALNTVQVLYTVNFTVTWESNIQGMIEIGGESSGWVYGGASLSVQSPCESSFTGAVKLNIPEYEMHNYSFHLEVVGLADTSGTKSLVGTSPYGFTGWPPTAFISLYIYNYSSFTIRFWDKTLVNPLNELCLNKPVVPSPRFHSGCSPLTSLYTAEYINMKIAPEVEGVGFYSNTGSYLGSEITVPINECTYYQIRVNSLYNNLNGTTINVVSNIEGIERTDSLVIPPAAYSFSKDYYEQEILLKEYKYVALEVRPSSCLNIMLPEFVNFTAEIIEGGDLASLLNIETDEKGDTLYGLSHNEGWLEFRLLGDADTEKAGDTIRVKVTASLPRIEPIELIFIYKAPEILVTFSPEVIAPGDTADVILKKKASDGTVTDFPPDQLFNVFIIEGQDYGTLYNPEWGITNGYFFGTGQGFKFIASEELPDSIAVQSTIAVQTISSSGGMGNILTADTSAINPGNKSAKYKNQLKGIQNAEDEDDWYYGYGTIKIGGGDCSDAPQCTESDEAPELLFVRVRDSTICLEANRRGGFEAKTESLFINFALIPCFNHQDDKWQFKLTEDNKVSLNYSLEICNEYLLKTYQEKLIYEVEDLRGKILNDSISVCNAYADILWHKVYGAVHAGDFYLVEVLISHENQHLSDFINLAENLYFQKYYDQFLEYRPHCSEAKNITIAKKGAEIAYGHLMENFRQELINNWKEKIGRTKRERLLYEQETLNRLYSIIDKYYRELQKLHPDKKPCDYCNVGCN